MAISLYILIGLYAVLLGMAGMKQLKEVGFQIQTFLVVVVSVGMLIIILIPNKGWMFILLIVAFALLHILAIVEGKRTKGRLTYSHHIIRFIFHCIIVLLVYKFIK